MLALQVVHQLQNLCLNGHVQRRGRLVRDQQLGPARQRHGDHDALAHAAGQLMRILLHDGLRVGNLHVAKHLNGLNGGLAPVHSLMDHERLGNLALDREHRVQTGHGLLEDNGNLVSADFLNLAYRQPGHVASLEHDASAVNVAVRVQKAQYAHGGNALAGAGLAHDAQRAAGLNGIGNAVDGFDDAALRGEEGSQVIDFKQCHFSSPFLSVPRTWDRWRRAGRRRSG